VASDAGHGTSRSIAQSEPFLRHGSSNQAANKLVNTSSRDPQTARVEIQRSVPRR